MENNKIIPTFIFESSWEVCNKVGGIYTVLSTRAKTLQDAMPDHVVFIGPDFWKGKENPMFKESTRMWAPWVKAANREGISVRVGRWNIPGNPCVILVDFNPYFVARDRIYAEAWASYGVDSLHAYGDYDEASMFSYAAGRVVESYYNFYLSSKGERVIYQAHEWMTGLGALYVRKHVPAIGTIFTTHATSIGRSIAGNNKPLYDYLYAYNGNQMAYELNMEAKHSVERQTAHNVDCFTTVSDVTAKECEELLDRPCDVVLMNGFENDFVPSGSAFTSRRKKARQALLRVANALTGITYPEDTIILATSGRYEFKNKGIDVFLEALHRLDWQEQLKRQVVAFIEVPAWVAGPRADLQQRLATNTVYDTALPMPFLTHNLNDVQNDKVLNSLRWFNKSNRPEERVKVIFVPCYLDGHDGIFNMSYYDVLIGNDLSVYPSYYEPWGYTPLESVAFHVPCITTSLSGFGMWANQVKAKAKGAENSDDAASTLADGVEVIHRTDYNYAEVADGIVRAVLQYASWDKKQVDQARHNAASIAQQALWKNFIRYYYDAYDIALQKAAYRLESM